jgi:hypothetical protein
MCMLALNALLSFEIVDDKTTTLDTFKIMVAAVGFAAILSGCVFSGYVMGTWCAAPTALHLCTALLIYICTCSHSNLNPHNTSV